MRKYLWMLLIMMTVLLTGCGSHNGSDRDEKVTLGYVTDKENITSEGMWAKAQYVGDTLYYAIYNKSRVPFGWNLYEKRGEEEPVQRMYPGDPYGNAWAADTDGNLYYFGYSKNGHWVLGKKDVTGEVLFENIIAEPSLGGAYGLAAAASADGVCIIVSDGNCLMWDNQGQFTGKADTAWYEDRIQVYSGDFGMVNGADGIYLFRRDDRNIHLKKVNLIEGTLGEVNTVTLPEAEVVTENGNILNYLHSAYEEGIYIIDYESLYLYDDISQELTEVFRWSEPGIDVTRNNVMTIGKDASGRLQFAGYDHSKEEGMIVRVEEMTGENSEREAIVIGYIGDAFPVSVGEYVEEFNRTQDEILAVPREYEDIETLQQDIAAGKGPDILELTGLDIDEYVEKGILEGLGSYLEESDRLNTEDILPSMLEKMTIQNDARFLASGFAIRLMLLGNAAADDADMTMEGVLALGQSGDGYLCDQDVYELFGHMLPYELDAYVDWEDRSCSFDDGRFESMLESFNAANLPEESINKRLLLLNAIRQGEYKAAFRSVSTLYDYEAMRESFEDIAVISGYPGSRGAEYQIEFHNGILGINSASEKKDMAWEYLEYHILEYAANCNQYSDRFSVLSEKFEEQLYPTRSANTFYVAVHPYTGRQVDVDFRFTEEDRDMIRTMVQTGAWSRKTTHFDGLVGKIIEEETTAFFDGEITAKEAADNIQSRVTAYMNE